MHAPTYPPALLDHCGPDLISGWIRPPDCAEAVQIVLEQPNRPPVELEIGAVRPVPAGSHHVALRGGEAAVAVRLLAGHARIVLRWSDATGASHEAVAGLAPRFRASATKYLEARLERASRADELPPQPPPVSVPPSSIWDSVMASPLTDLPAEAGVSRFDMLEGLVSRDESTIIGKDGFLFLYRGNNQLLEQYVPNDDDASRAAHWTGLISNRRRLVEETGASFLQVLVPEKTSILSHLLPFEINAPTPLSVRLRENMAAAGAGGFLDLAELMQGDTAAE